MENIPKKIEKTKLNLYIFTMGCSKCKDKKKIQEAQAQLKKGSNSKIDSWAGILILVWIALGIYGLIELIKNFISLL